MNKDIDDISLEPLRFEESIGFLLRRALQRHTVIFTDLMDSDITRIQTAVMAWLYESGACSQNLLGRHIAVDASTIKGVVDRLNERGLVSVEKDSADGRRIIVDLTEDGRKVFLQLFPIAWEIAERTLEPLSNSERKTLFNLLQKLT